MSKSKKNTITLNVETVENWYKMIDYIESAIFFWFPKNHNKWPFNFILDSLKNCSKEIEKTIKPRSNFDLNKKINYFGD